jgi:thymidine phosphorylase
LGQIVVHLGGGRLREGDKLDLSVGLSDLLGVGDEVEAQSPLARIHASSESAADAAAAALRAAYVIGEDGDAPPLVLERIG